MKRSHFVIVVGAATVGLTLVCLVKFWPSYNPFEHSYQQQVVPAAEPYYNAERIRVLGETARQGNADAAYELAIYYIFYHRPRTSESRALGDKWMELAAENGKPEAMIAFAGKVHRQGGRDNCAKAIALIHKAVNLSHNSETLKSAKNDLNSFKKDADCAGLL